MPAAEHLEKGRLSLGAHLLQFAPGDVHLTLGDALLARDASGLTLGVALARDALL